MKRYWVLSLMALGLWGYSGLASAQAAGETGAAPVKTAAADGAVTAHKAAASGGEALVVADFNSGDKPNNIGGDFGSWDKDPNDETQSSQMAFEGEDALGEPAGYSVRMDYDVDSPNPAYNGLWMKLNNLDATTYNTVNFYLKGAADKPFTKRIKIELKDSTMKPSPFIVTGWKIPGIAMDARTAWESSPEFKITSLREFRLMPTMMSGMRVSSKLTSLKSDAK